MTKLLDGAVFSIAFAVDDKILHVGVGLR